MFTFILPVSPNQFEGSSCTPNEQVRIKHMLHRTVILNYRELSKVSRPSR